MATAHLNQNKRTNSSFANLYSCKKRTLNHKYSLIKTNGELGTWKLCSVTLRGYYWHMHLHARGGRHGSRPLKSRAMIYFECKTTLMMNTEQFSIVVKALFSVMRRISCEALVTGIINKLVMMQFHFHSFRMSFNFTLFSFTLFFQIWFGC